MTDNPTNAPAPEGDTTVDEYVQGLQPDEKEAFKRALADTETAPWKEGVVRAVAFGIIFAGWTFFEEGGPNMDIDIGLWEAGKAFFAYLVTRSGEGVFDQVRKVMK